MLLPSKMTMRTLHTITFVVLAAGSSAQVRINKPLVLTGAGEADRQVTGLAPSTLPGAAQSAQVEQAGAFRYADAQAGTSWQVNVPSLNGAPGAGTQLMVGIPATPGNGALQLAVNGQGPYTVLDAPGTPLLAENTAALKILSLVFDGTAFHLLNGATQRRRDCPSGTVTVNEQYCIEPLERDTTDWYEAARTCIAANLRLCSWGEWHNACNIAATLGLTNMVGDWEWTDDSANEDEVVRTVGAGSCTQATTWYATGNAERRFRCCYSR